MKMITLFDKKHLKGDGGFTLIELIAVIAIIGILAAVAVPQYGAYKVRAYDEVSKSDIYHVYASCRAYWQDNPEGALCSMADATSANYGFNQSNNVVLTIVEESQTNFLATSSHAGSTVTYQIGPLGFATVQ